MTDAAAALTPGFMVRRAPGVLTKQLDGTMLLASGEGKQGHCMDRIGRRIWDVLAQPRSLAEVCQLLGGEFAVDPAVCLRDTTEFIRELLEKHLVVPHQPGT